MAPDWSRYWRSADGQLEAMHAHFQRHAYHRHSHETYSFGVTEDGVQSFNCRGSARGSAAGMIMAFNPDDPHDGRPCDELGFTYRIVHVGPELVAGVLADIIGRRAGLPLFADPVVGDPVLAGHLRAPCTARWSAARPRCAVTSCWPRRSARWCAGPPSGCCCPPRPRPRPTRGPSPAGCGR